MKSTPEATAKFQQTTGRMVVYNHAQRYCSACRRCRSVGQFKAGSEVCLKH